MFTCMCSCVLYPHAYLSQSLEYTQFIYKLFTQAQLYVFLYYTVFIFSGVNAIILICICFVFFIVITDSSTRNKSLSKKKCFSKCVSCHILRHCFCPSITKRVLCLSSFTVQDCQAAASLRLCLSPVLLNYFPDSLLILSLIDSPRINRLSKVNE